MIIQTYTQCFPALKRMIKTLGYHLQIPKCHNISTLTTVDLISNHLNLYIWDLNSSSLCLLFHSSISKYLREDILKTEVKVSVRVGGPFPEQICNLAQETINEEPGVHR